MSELHELTAAELLAAYAGGQASPVEAVASCLERIEAVDGSLNAVLTLLADEATAGAVDSAARWQRGEARPLEGVPFGLKDIVATAGIRTTGGSALFRDDVPVHDAALAARMTGAGGLLLAKLHTFEFACGGADNRTFGPCRNPWNTDRTTGGSSSGSGAAVAARELPLAIGTDTGGSIRIPAAYCGITGLKPTYGRVPRHGVMGLSWTLDHAGPMTRSAVDAAHLLAVIAGHDPRDPSASRRPVPDYVAATTAPVAGLRVGRPRGRFEDRIHPDVAAAFETSLADLAGLGVEVVDVELPDVELAETSMLLIMYAEMLSLHADHAHLIEERDSMGAGLLANGPYVSAADYLRAMRHRPVWQQQVGTAMAGLAALAVPGAVSVAPRLDDMLADLGDEQVDWLMVAMRTCSPFNLTGQPALSLPAGFSAGMPVSLQLVGHPHGEEALLALGAAFQDVTTHHTAAPVLSALPTLPPPPARPLQRSPA
jgi:aspartyl-tRNA(Asn)/glutamyl-tRNA(Gln) amidotransferase subunit A